MTLGVLAPAHSPLTLAALLAGVAGALRPSSQATQALESLLRNRTGASGVVLTDSGTSALQLAMADSVREAARPIVALPAWSCYDVLSAALAAEVQFLFYDVDLTTLAPTDDALAELSSASVASIVLVHAFGVPVDVGRVRAALGPSVRVIEDAAQAWGATHAGGPVGSQGDYAIFSFSRGKGITGGSGGALLAREALHTTLAAGPRGGKDVLRAAALWGLASPVAYAIPASLPFLQLGITRYRPPRTAGPISAAAARIVLAAEPLASAAAARRRTRGAAWRDALSGHSALTMPHGAPGAEPSYLRFPVVAEDALGREAAVAAGRRLGVAASYPRTLPALASTLGVAPVATTRTPGANSLAERLFTLPTHDWVTSSVVRQVIAKLER